MNPLIYVIPVVVIAIIIIAMIPAMRKQSKKIGEQMAAIKSKNVHINIIAGNINSINGVAGESIPNAGTYYGIDNVGPITLEMTPNFMYADTHYRSHTPMTIEFNAEAGKTYEVGFSAKKPKEDPNIIDVSPIVNKEIIFKTTFYIITKDVTDEQGSRMMREDYKG